MLSTTVTVEDEVVGATIVRQWEYQGSVLVAVRLNATPTTVNLAITPGVETRIVVTGFILDGNGISRFYPFRIDIEEVTTSCEYSRTINLRAAVVIENEVECAVGW